MTKLILKILDSLIGCWFIFLFFAMLGVVGGMELGTLSLKAGMLAEFGIMGVGVLSYWVLV